MLDYSYFFYVEKKMPCSRFKEMNGKDTKIAKYNRLLFILVKHLISFRN